MSSGIIHGMMDQESFHRDPRPMLRPRVRGKPLTLPMTAVMLISYGLVSEAAPQDATTYQALNRCGVPVVLPSAPPGFRQTTFNVDLCKESCRFQPIPCRQAFSSYSVVYIGPNSCRTTFSGLVGGMFGEGPPPRSWTTRSQLFGPMVITESYDKSDLSGLSTSWDRKSHDSIWNLRYHSKFPDAQFTYSFSCVGRAFDPDTALAFLRSLRVIAAD